MAIEPSGWIKIHRKFLSWEWYTTPNMVHIFIYLLLAANHERCKWKGIVVERGQLITGLLSLKKNTGISIQSTRTCLERLKSTGEITIKSTNKYSIITICNYECYQNTETVTNKQINNQDNKQLTNNQQSTNNKQEEEEYKNEEKERIKPIGDKNIFLDNIIQTYSEEHGDYKILNRKKEREYADMILTEYKSNNPDSDEEKTINDLRIIFNGCINIDDKWKRENMCIRYIANNYNVLKQYFKNGKSRNKQSGATKEQLTAVIFKHFETDSASNGK